MKYPLIVIQMLGGLALFLYGMRLMSSSLKESSSGKLKSMMEKVTGNPFKAFLLGLGVTAVIQSSTATIVITSGLVAGGIITLNQSLGIIIGANVGTTVTGQIVRLMDLNSDSTSWLTFLKPSTLAPIALIVGILLLVFIRVKRSDAIGNVAMGFGILFTGLMNMSNSVSVLTETGIIDKLFGSIGKNPILGYLCGAGVAFALQSSSSTIAILQTMATNTVITFGVSYIIIVGIYLGDCLTTGIVCSIGAKADAKRVGVVNIIYNLSKTVVVLVAVNVLRAFGVFDTLWEHAMTAGGIANANSIFNLGCAILLLPLTGVYARLSKRIVKDDVEEKVEIPEFAALNPIFYATPALAFGSCYNALKLMFNKSVENIDRAFGLLNNYDSNIKAIIDADEDIIDSLADGVSNYLVQLSPHINEDMHVHILEQYYKLVGEFEHMGDHAFNISETAVRLYRENVHFSEMAHSELAISREVLDRLLKATRDAFEKRDIRAAREIEPLEEVMDDMINALSDNHMARLREGKCSVNAGTGLLDVLTHFSRIADTCSNVGVSVMTRVNPEIANRAHNYVTELHLGHDREYNKAYHTAHDMYFEKLNKVQSETHAEAVGASEGQLQMPLSEMKPNE
ncbi:MAG: Na/Pi cotransporter family protein [Lachnospiraceae bacterium]|nr:Na/Pi cotransporter family protein [Lachnospiraceae bacterium]